MIQNQDINNEDLKYCINLEYEKNQRNIIYLNNWLYLPEKYKGYNNTHLKINNNESFCNPLIARCYNGKYRRKLSLRTNTFFNIFPHFPVTIILEVIFMNMCNYFKSKIIVEKIKSKYYLETFNYNLITSILDKLREVIAHKMYDIYKIEEIQ